jgi:hypothetical protein
VINGLLYWRRYFAQNRSVDGKTAVVVAILRDFIEEAEQQGYLDTPRVKERFDKSGKNCLRTNSCPKESRAGPSGDCLGTLWGTTRGPSYSTISSGGAVWDDDLHGARVPVSRCLKRKILSFLTFVHGRVDLTAFDNIPVYGESRIGSRGTYAASPIGLSNPLLRSVHTKKARRLCENSLYSPRSPR